MNHSPRPVLSLPAAAKLLGIDQPTLRKLASKVGGPPAPFESWNGVPVFDREAFTDWMCKIRNIAEGIAVAGTDRPLTK